MDIEQKIKIRITEQMALFLFEREINSSWVLWAVELIEAGYESTALYILAGESEPFNQFEMRALVKSVFVEIEFEQFESVEFAIISYTAIQVCRFLDNQLTMDCFLKKVFELCLEHDTPSALFDFYTLYHAKNDLDKFGESSYWNEATSDNFEAVLRTNCTDWLGKYAEIFTDC